MKVFLSNFNVKMLIIFNVWNSSKDPNMDRVLILKLIKDNLEWIEFGKIFIFRIRPIPNGLNDSGDLVGSLCQKCVYLSCTPFEDSSYLRKMFKKDIRTVWWFDWLGWFIVPKVWLWFWMIMAMKIVIKPTDQQDTKKLCFSAM